MYVISFILLPVYGYIDIFHVVYLLTGSRNGITYQAVSMQLVRQNVVIAHKL